MSKTFSARQIVGRPADRSELQALRALIVEKRDLLILGAADPTPGHDIGYGADIRIVDFVVLR